MNWDNRASDETDVTAGKTYEDCRQLCMNTLNCIQFRFSPGKCRLSRNLVLGTTSEPQHRMDSGWILDRVDKIAARMHCEI